MRSFHSHLQNFNKLDITLEIERFVRFSNKIHRAFTISYRHLTLNNSTTSRTILDWIISKYKTLYRRIARVFVLKWRVRRNLSVSLHCRKYRTELNSWAQADNNDISRRQSAAYADSTSLPGRVVTTLPHWEIKPQLCDEFFDETEWVFESSRI